MRSGKVATVLLLQEESLKGQGLGERHQKRLKTKSVLSNVH